jgi:serine/threonine protein kinase
MTAPAPAFPIAPPITASQPNHSPGVNDLIGPYRLLRVLGDETGAVAIDDRYRLLRLIGEGGMGEVWLAEQKKPVRRRVAIKLIKAGMDTREVMARFESERQALALMDHPAIARVFDAGSTPAGRPYFVMEYVPAFRLLFTVTNTNWLSASGCSSLFRSARE